MKRFLYLLPILTLLLTGCGSKRVSICLRQDNPQLALAMEEALTRQGFRVTVWDADLDQSKQTQQLKKLAQRSHAVLVEPVITEEGNTLLDLAREQGTPVIFLNYPPDSGVLDSWEKACYLGFNLAETGAAQVGLLPKEADRNGDGSLACLVISGPEDNLDAIAWNEQISKMEYVQVLALEHGDGSEVTGRAICRRQLARLEENPEVILCYSDMMALGALETLRDGSHDAGEEVCLVGFGGRKEALEALGGGLTGTVMADYPTFAREAARLTGLLMQAEPVEKKTLVDLLPVTQGNVGRFLQ